jgi:glycosyltransferase involved in cell wall biosynthesis
MVSRLLWSKGVREYVAAAELVRRRHPAVRFQLAGEWDPVHPDAVPPCWVDAAVASGAIEFLGYLDNVAEQLRSSDVFVLPSYYPEGVPRVLLEASACGLPVVSTDVAGCREAVEDQQTGLLVPARDSRRLADAIAALIEAPDWGRRLGEAGRRRALERFDLCHIVEQHLAVYRELGLDATPELSRP